MEELRPVGPRLRGRSGLLRNADEQRGSDDRNLPTMASDMLFEDGHRDGTEEVVQHPRERAVRLCGLLVAPAVRNQRAVPTCREREFSFQPGLPDARLAREQRYAWSSSCHRPQ